MDLYLDLIGKYVDAKIPYLKGYSFICLYVCIVLHSYPAKTQIGRNYFKLSII